MFDSPLGASKLKDSGHWSNAKHKLYHCKVGVNKFKMSFEGYRELEKKKAYIEKWQSWRLKKKQISLCTQLDND